MFSDLIQHWEQLQTNTQQGTVAQSFDDCQGVTMLVCHPQHQD